MLGICFFVEPYRAVASAQRPAFRDWIDLGKAFGVDQVIGIIDPTEPLDPTLYQYPKLIVHESLTAAMTTTSDTPWVFVEDEPTATSLANFTHPTDVVYCFGSDRTGLNEVDRNLGDWLSIPTQSALWANQAAAVVLSHR